ncbi:hypothetical protein PT974_09070 [Cladobotryum mycophilum]|uniref:C2H2-type domain-containing protein n=1 Tax=Cladobotryum mycophilum TaxID=491253 RepID=A0ABR0SG56_9HYPO
MATAPTASVVAPTNQEPTTTTMNGSVNGPAAPSVVQTPVPLPYQAPRSTVASSTPSAVASPTVTTASIKGGNSASGANSATPQTEKSKPQAQYASPMLSSSAPPVKSGTVTSQAPSAAAAAAGNSASPAMTPSIVPLPKTAPAYTFRSPKTKTDQAQNTDLQGQYNELKAKIAQAHATVVRQVIRDQWQKCLVGSDFHTTFLANATFHHAPVAVLGKVIGDFGQRAVKHAKHQVIKHLNKVDLDELTDDILSKASNKFMDRVVARRLETIGAQDLVNALARAERLGYDAGDIVEGGKPGGTRGEHVIPSLHFVAPHAVPQYQAPHHQAPQRHIPQHHVPQHHVPQHIVPQHLLAPQPQNHRQISYAPGQGIPNSGAPPTKPPPATPSSAPKAPLLELPPGIVACHLCNRPCSSDKALAHHHKKAGCQKSPYYQQVGIDACIHCGSHFSGVGGLAYHVKSQVCGIYSAETLETITSLVQSFVNFHSQPRPQPQPQATTVPAPPSNSVATPITSRIQVAKTSPSPAPGNDPYAHLTQERREAFEDEMKRAEEKYGNLMREAMSLPALEQGERLAKLKNSYNTKQSTTRKKYGIRLRERRTVAEIEAEQQRLLGTPSEEASEQPAKRARIDSDGQSVVTKSYSSTPASSPRKRVPMTEMGGLTGSSATAELVDPTSSLTPSRPRHSGHSQVADDTPSMVNQGTSDDPMQIDDSSGNSDTDGDQDIPASLP